MAWYTGKSAISVFAFGESNIAGYAFEGEDYAYPTGLQQDNNSCYYYATADGAVPYNPSGLGWRNLSQGDLGTNLPGDPPGRSPEWFDAFSPNGVPANGQMWAGQLLGNLGSPTMQMANTIQDGTGLPVYTVLADIGGSTSRDWLGPDYIRGVSYIDEAIAIWNAAKAGIPLAPNAADVIYFSVGGGDLLYGDPSIPLYDPTSPHNVSGDFPTDADTYFNNMYGVRQKLIDAGIWIPGVTQVIVQDIPRAAKGGIVPNYPGWEGLERILTRFNDRITLSNSVDSDMALLGVYAIHYTSQSYTDMGRVAGEKVLAQIPKQQAITSVGGSRLSVGGLRLRVNAA